MQLDFVHHTVAWSNPGTLTRNPWQWYVCYQRLLWSVNQSFCIWERGWGKTGNQLLLSDSDLECPTLLHESSILRRFWKMFKGIQHHKAMCVSHDLSVVPKRQQIIPRVLPSRRDVTVGLVKPWHEEQLQIWWEMAGGGNSAWDRVSCFAVLSLLGLQGSRLKCWRFRNAEECYDMHLQVLIFRSRLRQSVFNICIVKNFSRLILWVERVARVQHLLHCSL